MKTWVRRSLNVGALTAGALLASGTAAQADTILTSTDNLGIGNGIQALIPVQAPVNVCGNAVGVVGTAGALCDGGSAASLDPEWSNDYFLQTGEAGLLTGGNSGILNGVQAAVPVQVPINACGNAVAVAGRAGAACQGGAAAEIETPDPDGGYEAFDQPQSLLATGAEETTLLTAGNLGVLNGVQALVPVQVPIDICGNAIGVLGTAKAACDGGAAARL